jgi:hypothetical protein
MSLALGERLGRLNEAAAAVGVFFEIHIHALGLFRTPSRRGRNIVIGLYRSAPGGSLIQIKPMRSRMPKPADPERHPRH